MKENKAHHNTSHKEKSKHFCLLHLGIGVTKENIVKHWMEQYSYSYGEETEQGELS